MTAESGSNHHTKPQDFWGGVGATPNGACLSTEDAESWQSWRAQNLDPIVFPREGFGHVYGQDVIDEVDNHPLGSRRVGEEKKSDGHDYGSTKSPGKSRIDFSITD